MSERKKFIEKIAPFAMRSQIDYGIPASITIAQAILESGNGKSKLSTAANNFFGIKADPFYLKKNLPFFAIDTLEYNKENKVYTEKKAKFRKYKDLEGSFKDHAEFLQKNKRYKDLFNSIDPYLWAEGLQKSGYSTSPKYASTLKNIIIKENLKQYDLKAAQSDKLQVYKRAFKRNYITIGLILFGGFLIYRYAKKKTFRRK